MSLSAQLITALRYGAAYWFANWPNPAIPIFGAGIYTVWDNDGRFIYVGMSGRGITAETNRRNKLQGIYTRLRSHASGCRSGDQFCVYVADRLVLPNLRRTSQLSPLDATKWIRSCADTSMRTSVIGS